MFLSPVLSSPFSSPLHSVPLSVPTDSCPYLVPCPFLSSLCRPLLSQHHFPCLSMRLLISEEVFICILETMSLLSGDEKGGKNITAFH